MTFCPCNSFDHTFSGGVSLGGSAIVTDNALYLSGGVVLGGSALVTKLSDGVSWDGAEVIYGLNDLTYKDSGPLGLDGSAGYVEPEIAQGVFCLDSLFFEFTETKQGVSINLPADTIPATSAFSCSLWVKLEDYFAARTLYSRGYRDNLGNDWVFRIGYSHMNHIVVYIQDSIDYYLLFSDITLENDKWYHVSCNFNPGVSLTVYIDGELQGVNNEAPSSLLTLGNGSFVGRYNDGSFPTCYLQELRLYPEIKTVDYWQAEKDNFCRNGFYTVGDIENSTYS